GVHTRFFARLPPATLLGRAQAFASLVVAQRGVAAGVKARLFAAVSTVMKRLGRQSLKKTWLDSG
ncbi:MAG: hypothetical protein ACI9W2_001607, partial [Gammaproteobacteria bacterium]